MKIQGTKKLLEAIPFEVSTDSGEERNPLYEWHANLLVINRKKTMVLMNDSNRYVIVLHGLKANEFKRLGKVIQETIRQTFQAERIRDEVIDRYLAEAGPVSFHKTKDRSHVAQLNKACDNVGFAARELVSSELIQTAVSKQASRWLTGGGKRDMFHPYEELFTDLEKMAGCGLFSSEAAIMKISMPFEGLSIWRRVLVPLDLSFAEFHDVIQTLFGWQDSHLHEFHVFDQNEMTEGDSVSGNFQHVLNIVMNDDLESYPQEVDKVLENTVALSDILQISTVLKYVYNFGDNWQHEIVLEKFVDDEPVKSPVCLDGEGDAPPEDCGGEPGFREFLLIMADPYHPEHAEMKQWAASQLYREFDKGLVNHRLRRM
ncbi:plasmid pRiA4b ORF-3 family protein [Sporosarcina sp. Te-1]|uniref:plasmid pRiA4b ORF-3 family protein n=1 Tax=Sporosarcina sp. Te-1 TaxID=2818390 RepID=UPI001A9E8652|nr:plasmid pRiA4b ORF-3 family protein [Sporosarcina sp. Te-1]QTD42763.1 plasmid pRiA4b ORF-3 family protein [Sporosarcina sp. Te-1]